MTRHSLLLLALVLTIPAYGQRPLTCKSFTDKRTYCGFPSPGATPVLQRQLSSAPCVRGTSWGVDKRGLWVANGCQAVFAMTFNNGPGNNYPPNGWRPGLVASRPRQSPNVAPTRKLARRQLVKRRSLLLYAIQLPWRFLLHAQRRELSQAGQLRGPDLVLQSFWKCASRHL